MLELVIWNRDGFTVEIGYAGERAGRSYFQYALRDEGEVIFEGADYSPAPSHLDDRDQIVAGLLGFLTLKPGDTDDEYFERHTPRQLEWVESSRAEELSYIQRELEGG